MTKATDTQAQQVARRRRNRLLLIVAFLAAFIIGYLIPMKDSLAMRATVERLSEDLAVANRTLLRNEVGEHVSVAALYVATGDFDSAGRHTAQFFDGLEPLRDDLTQNQLALVDSVSARRDDIVQLLRAKNDLALYQLLDVTSKYEASVLGRSRVFTDPRLR